jgi:hypothetical protein
MRLVRTLVRRSRSAWLGGAVLGCGLWITACVPQLGGLQARDDSSDTSERPSSNVSDNFTTSDCGRCTVDAGVNPMQPGPEEQTPAECGPGTYREEEEGACEECPLGSFSSGVNARECVQHRECGPGTYQSTSGSAIRDVICSSCPAGTFASESGSKACREWSDCEPGEYVAVQGSAAADRQCAPCAEGETSTVVNSGACTAEGECSAGTVRLPLDASPDVECRACAPGAYCAGGDNPELECDEDSWDNDENPATPCIAKTVCVEGQYVVDAGSATRDRVCAACGDGRYSTSNNAKECLTWTRCTAGTRIATPGTAVNNRVCIPCDSGTYSDGANAPVCRAWTTCLAPSNYEAQAPSDTKDRICGTCEAPAVSREDNASTCSLVAFQMVDGQVVMEAENYHDRAPSSTGADSWYKGYASNISGGGYIEVGPMDGGDSWTQNVEATAPRVDYRVNFTQTGRFYIHVRGDAGDGAEHTSESVYAGLDGVATPQYAFALQGGVWGWLSQPVEVAKTGIHTVHLYGREDGFRADKIVVSTSATSPTGNGPAESAQR